MIIVSIFSINWIKQYYLYIKTLKAFLCFESFFSFYIANLFSNCQIFIKKLFMFYHKIHTFSLIGISFICTHFWKVYAERCNFFIIFVTNEIFKILVTKRKLIREYYFINIYIAYWNRTLILMKFVFSNSVSSSFIFFIHFYIWF